jgi:glutathione reductase (NADPH)
MVGEELLKKSDEFLELDELLPSIVFIGGGYIAFEFAHVAARTGAKVTIVHRGSRPLEHFDPDLVDKLVQRTRGLGVEVHLGTHAVEVKEISSGFAVRAISVDRSITVEAAMVVHAAGRVPEIDDLDLSAAGVQSNNRGVAVNEYLQSLSNPVVYAAGDAAATGGPPLTPRAGYDGSIVAANLLHGNHREAQYIAIPTVVFTTPPLASVGLTEEAAAREGLRFRTNFQNTSSWYSSRRVGESCAGSKVLVEADTDRILGAHLVGPGADELINVLTLAVRASLRVKELKDVLFAYPTHSSDIQYML